MPGWIGVFGNVFGLGTFNDGSGEALYAGGNFNMAGGVTANNIAKWSCTGEIFSDGFESGDTSVWSYSAP